MPANTDNVHYGVFWHCRDVWAFIGAQVGTTRFLGTEAWAREFAAEGITVNAVAPGLIATPLTRKTIGEEALMARGHGVPLGRLAEPREIAYAVAWLAGPEAAMMTGQTVSPNGGVSIDGI